MNKRIAVFHFSPLELYPPVMNFLDCLQEKLSEYDTVRVYTTRPPANMELYIPKGKQVFIKRLAYFTVTLSAASRIVQYLRYYLISLLQCLRFRPSKVFYYETLSSFTPNLLKSLRGNQVELFIHYHEYMTREEYSRMLLNNIFHRFERKIYKRAKWISHNNEFRMQLFLKDLGGPALTNTRIYPNYPPSSWATPPKDKITNPLKLICVGAMGSLEKLYIRETFEWVRSKEGAILLDIYSFKVAEEIKSFNEQLGSKYICFKGSVDYKNLPQLLRQYDIGLILYKGLFANTIYSASNKLFEYLVCGLGVWYPGELIGSHEYNSPDYWPKVLPLDFTRLGQYNLDELVERKAGYRRQVNYSCKEASSELINMIIS